MPEAPPEEEAAWRTFVIEEGVTYQPVEYDLPAEPVPTFPARPEPVFTQVHVDLPPPEPQPAIEAAQPAMEAEAAGIAIDTKTLLWIGGGVALLWALAALGKTGRGIS